MFMTFFQEVCGSAIWGGESSRLLSAFLFLGIWSLEMFVVLEKGSKDQNFFNLELCPSLKH